MVLLVIGIVSAIVMPRYSGVLRQQDMRRTINVIRGTVRYLQARAALTKRVYRLTFDLDQQEMSVCFLIPEGCEPESTRELREYTFPKTVRVLDMVNPHGEKTQEGEAATHFHPTGLAEPSTIHLGGEGQPQKTMRIESLTGRVKVFDGYVDPEKG